MEGSDGEASFAVIGSHGDQIHTPYFRTGEGRPHVKQLSRRARRPSWPAMSGLFTLDATLFANASSLRHNPMHDPTHKPTGRLRRVGLFRILQQAGVIL